MSASLNCSATWYAVIAGLRTERFPELLVVAYPDEESLRNLIAGPSIMALGFNSRDKAVQYAEQCSQTTLGPDQAISGAVSDKPSSRHDCPSRKCQFIELFVDARKNVSSLLQYAVALGIISLYSRNAASVAVRTFLGV